MTNGSYTIITGDCMDGLEALPEKHFHCCVTSPPYFALRDYGTATWEGGDSECDHVERNTRQDVGRVYEGDGRPRVFGSTDGAKEYFKHTCGKCGARRIDKQIGLEPTPAEFVACMVRVFAAVWRVLRDDGVCFVNLGDSYCGGGGFSPDAPSSSESKSGKYGSLGALKQGGIKPGSGIKPKDLMLIPHRTLIALQEWGWTVRDDIVWAKPSPMPGSQRDRCTSSYEHIFQLTKRPRYFFDMESIKEPLAGKPHAPGNVGAPEHGFGGANNISDPAKVWAADGTRIPRNVWRIASEGFGEAHFATFPVELPRRCIKAATSEKGCCPACGAPWVRVVEMDDRQRAEPKGNRDRSFAWSRNGIDGGLDAGARSSRTIGWRPGCDCWGGDNYEALAPHAPVPCRVLDCFGGAGTTAIAACQLGRDCTLIELSPDYVEMARARIDKALKGELYRSDDVTDAPLFMAMEDR